MRWPWAARRRRSTSCSPICSCRTGAARMWPASWELCTRRCATCSCPARSRSGSIRTRPSSPSRSIWTRFSPHSIDRAEIGRVASKGRPYRTFLVDGFEILVGRGEDDNDTLTFDVAEPHDLWLHVAGGVPGSHVVVRRPAGAEVPAAVVKAAAAAAAWFSKARGAPRVEVHLCRRADVSKPAGA